MIQHYLKNTEWVKTLDFEEGNGQVPRLVAIFQKYAHLYDFDYLMLAAQGYQESMLNQAAQESERCGGDHAGYAEDAAASPINIPDVTTSQSNIEAGAKMLRNIADTYFNDPKIAPLNRTLFCSQVTTPVRTELLAFAIRQNKRDWTLISGSIMSSWWPPKKSDNKRSYTSQTSTNITSLTSWHSSNPHRCGLRPPTGSRARIPPRSVPLRLALSRADPQVLLISSSSVISSNLLRSPPGGFRQG